MPLRKDKYFECQNKFFPCRILLARESKNKLSQEHVLFLLKELVVQEDKDEPLSDEQLVELLQERKIKLSRRVISKYRQKLGIANSYRRKHRV